MNRQDRRRKRTFPGVESLEGRKVLSTAGTAMIGHLKGALTDGITYMDVQGTAHGIATRVVGNPDVGTTVMLHGLGKVTNLNSVKVSGMLHGTGFIASSHVEGDVTLSNPKGSLILHLQSPSVGGFHAPTSGTYQFTISKGTGSYAHDFGNGTVDVVLSTNTFKLTFHGKPNIY